MKKSRKFSVRARIRSATHAVRGIVLLFKSGHNFWGHVFFGTLAVYLGFILNITSTEWVLIILTIGSVVVTEALNTAIEVDIDLTSPSYHPYARDTKDIAAGAVVLAVIFSLIVASIIFLPKIFLGMGIWG